MAIFKRLSDHEGVMPEHNPRSALEYRSPLSTDEQDSPEPERTTRLDEEAGTAVHELKEPPQAEG